MKSLVGEAHLQPEDFLHAPQGLLWLQSKAVLCNLMKMLEVTHPST